MARGFVAATVRKAGEEYSQDKRMAQASTRS
jgi:hypothetical protein